MKLWRVPLRTSIPPSLHPDHPVDVDWYNVGNLSGWRPLMEALADQEFQDAGYDELVRRSAEFNRFGRETLSRYCFSLTNGNMLCRSSYFASLTP
jgi:hypothetical protein